MLFLTRLLPSFLVAWLLSFTIASLFHSQYVVNQLVNVGVVVPLGDRLNIMAQDWLGMITTYGVIIAVALAIAFTVANWLSKKYAISRDVWFTFAGIAALATVLIAFELIMKINVIAGARGWGFYTQLLAGAAGGFVFSKVSAALTRK